MTDREFNEGRGDRPWIRPLIATAVLLVVLLGWQGYRVWRVATIVDDSMETALAVDGEITVQVEMSFEPEQFHMVYLQQRGRVVGVEDRVVTIRGVDETELRKMAGEYWISRIEVVDE